MPITVTTLLENGIFGEFQSTNHKRLMVVCSVAAIYTFEQLGKILETFGRGVAYLPFPPTAGKGHVTLFAEVRSK